MTTDLNTINIKGKEYVPVSERLRAFNADYPEGSITTELVSDPSAKEIIIKATVKPTPNRTFTGYSQATIGDGYINKTSALENAETSAVGRALGMMGIGVVESVASADEIVKATSTNKITSAEVPPDPTDDWMNEPLEEKQEVHFCQMHGKDLKDRGKGIWDHRMRLNEDKNYDANGLWHSCQGKGWFISER